MTTPSRLPTYKELLQRVDAPPGSTWGLFGQADQLGTINLLQENSLTAAASEVRVGKAYSLDLRSDVIRTSLAPTRQPAEHHIFSRTPYHHDEWIDRYYPQFSSQIDGLRHIGHPDHGFYNGADPARFTPDDDYFGIARLAAAPIAGRGVLLDIGRHLDLAGTPIDHLGGQPIDLDVVLATAERQGTVVSAGDIVLLRFGWLRWYQQDAPRQVREHLAERQVHPGLRQSEATVAWLWDQQISMVAGDNFALECWPAVPESPFFSRSEQQGETGDPHAGIMHRAIIGLLGMPIGELWDFEALAEACASDERWTFLLTVSPLPLVGGVGSPANAIAIR